MLLLAAGVALALHGDAQPERERDSHVTASVRGMTLDAPRPPTDEGLQHLADLGVNTLVVVPFGWQAPGTTEVRLNNHNGRWYSEGDDGIRDLAHRAATLGMSVVIKPHVWIRGASRMEMDFDDEAEWHTWEESYRTFVTHYARLSEEIDAPFFVVGTELSLAARSREAFWRSLIAGVREVYHGRLTYAANWWNEYEHVAFWDALDYVGVQAYFPLSDQTATTGPALAAAWDRHLAALEEISAKYHRPILFTEIGYRSVAYAAAEPWRWPGRREVAPPAPNLQAELYEAFFERVWHEPWFAGAVLWKWRPGADTTQHALDYTIQGKPAEAVVRRWFGGAIEDGG